MVYSGDTANVDFSLITYQSTSDIVSAIGRISYRGQSRNTTGGLYWSRVLLTSSQYGPRSGYPKLIVLITSGQPTTDANLLSNEVAVIKSLNIRIVTIGITNSVSRIY